MRRVLAALLALAAFSGSALADRWVSTTGSGSLCSESVPCQLSIANSVALPGETVHMADGTYGDQIRPVRSNVKYRGNIANPTAVKVTQMFFDQDDIAVRWVQSNGPVRFPLVATRDTLHKVTVRDSFSTFEWRGDFLFGDSLDIQAFRMTMDGADSNFYPVYDWVEGSRIQNSRIYLSSRSGTGNIFYLRSAKDHSFERVNFVLRAYASFNDAQGFNLYNAVNNRFDDCMFDIGNYKTTSDNVKFAWNMREQTRFNQLAACTLYVHTAPGRVWDIIMSNSGTTGNATGRNRYDSLLVITDVPISTYGGVTYWQDGARNDTLLNSVYVSRGEPPFQIDFDGDSTVVEHNTFIAIDTRDAVQLYRDPFGSAGSNQRLRRNILWTGQNPDGSRGVMTRNSSWDNETMFESLYYSPGGDSSFAVRDIAGGSSSPSAYDPSTPDSRWGNPLFAATVNFDSIMSWVFVQQKDPFKLQAGSVGLWDGWTNDYVGARGAFVPPPADNTRPAPVSNLVAQGTTGGQSVRFTFTAVGDDSLTGTASSYDIRYRTDVPVTEGNWATSTQAVGEPFPKASGQSENFILGGFNQLTTYYFGMKVSDEVPFTSALSNTDTTLTLKLDEIRPAQPANFVASALNPTQVRLTFDAVGDDSLSNGPPSIYAVSRGVVPITDAAFFTHNVTFLDYEPLAYPATESITVFVPAGGGTYYFAVKAVDDYGYQSVASASDSAAMPATGDVTAPARILDLHSVPLTATSIVLGWTATGDDASTGTATSYDIRYRTDGPLDDTNWGSSTQIGGEPTPKPSGQAEVFTVTGLQPSTQYWFAMEAWDEVPNNSPISVNTSVTTLDGEIPPGEDQTRPDELRNFRAAAIAAGQIDVTWLASGDDSLTGAATQYDIRYTRGVPLTESNWATAVQVLDDDAMVPAVAGSAERLTVWGHPQATTYYFGGRVRDDAGHWSGVVTDSAVTPYTTLTDCNTPRRFGVRHSPRRQRMFFYTGNDPSGFPYRKAGAWQDTAFASAAKFEIITLDASPFSDVAHVKAMIDSLKAATGVTVMGLLRGAQAFYGSQDSSQTFWGDEATVWDRLVAIRQAHELQLQGGGVHTNINLDLTQPAARDSFIEVVVSIAEALDGVFIDQFCENIAFLETPTPFNYGGRTQAEFLAAWTEAFHYIGEAVRERVGPNKILMSNCGQVPPNGFNGHMAEVFFAQNGGTWDANMAMMRADRTWPSRNIVSTQADVTYPTLDPNLRKKARFGLASALLTDNAVAGVVRSSWDVLRGHSPWWFDEYAVTTAGSATTDVARRGWLGAAIGDEIQTDTVHYRFFENGMVIVNPTTSTQVVGPVCGYRRIRGNLENDGDRDEFITLPFLDAAVLVKE